jgi:hypothetical protein
MFIDLLDAAMFGIGEVFALAGGLTGYEGQPGNQGGNNGGNGLRGYEGQPGNQGGN